MAGQRIYGQTIVLEDGSRVAGKNIRLTTTNKFLDLYGTNPTRTVGVARVGGREIPVRRTRGRSRWEQAGDGVFYSARRTPQSLSNPYVY